MHSFFLCHSVDCAVVKAHAAQLFAPVHTHGKPSAAETLVVISLLTSTQMFPEIPTQ